MFQLGSLLLPSNVFCAPLAGCSDLPFRRMLARYRPGLMYCEMVKMDALVRHDPSTYRLLDYEIGMHPIGAQLCGSKPELAGECARIVEGLGFDVIDLNCGCPVDKVTKDGSGSGLLKMPEKIGEIVANMVAAVKIPVTVKVRAGWDSASIVAPEITKIVEEAGAKAICVHGRTRAQGYRGPADWEYIRAAKEAAKEILVIGNGDILRPIDAERMQKETGCDAVLLARGTMGQPWLIEDIYRHFSGLDPLERSAIHYRDVMLEHFEHILSYQTPRRALLDFRRVGCWFLRNGRGVRHLREAINRSLSIEEALGHIAAYPWEEVDFSPQESLALDGV
ncbi:MAG: tRNA dihydrouridine synthase DusB [Verrucomicrobia bacterium]|nr:tRNA dihydrouridine synthase DusB [Verrucomicrobiota bacterium]